jgi:hypothetical protein
MEFAAMKFNLLRVDDKASSCLPIRRGGNLGKCLKADFWRCNCSRDHRIPSIGSVCFPKRSVNFRSSGEPSQNKQSSKRLSCFGTAFAL